MTLAERAAQRVYDELLTRTGEAIPRPRIDPVRRLAELAGSPQLSYPVIQVAGTNGKTTTSRAIDSLLRAHGMRTGLFTSPHLLSFSERFQIDGEPAGGNELADAWDQLQPALHHVDEELAAAGQGPITFFEALTVLAFSLFADAPVEVAIIEVGMGGEWDATNIVEAEVAVITPIGLDHTAILGPDLATIARTKAGIIKPGATVVSAEQQPEALSEIVEVVERQEARLFLARRDFELVEDLLAVGGRQISVRGLHGHSYDPTFVPLFGGHQAENVSVSIAAVEAFLGAERPIPEEILDAGIGGLTSPGRLQLIGDDPIVYVDAAHNPHGAEAVARAVSESFTFTGLALVLGSLAEKDAAGVLAALAPIAEVMYLTPVESPRTMPVDRLLEVSEEVVGAERDLTVEATESLAEAIEIARSWASGADGRAVLVAGSVVLAGEAIAHARDEGWSIVGKTGEAGGAV